MVVVVLVFFFLEALAGAVVVDVCGVHDEVSVFVEDDVVEQSVVVAEVGEVDFGLCLPLAVGRHFLRFDDSNFYLC